jgi:hypothetical protein
MEMLLSKPVQNALAAYYGKLIDAGGEAGSIKLYTRDKTLLVTLKFSYPAFLEPSEGTIEAGPITPDRAVADGKAVFGRISNSKGGIVFDCDVAKKGAVINLNSVDILKGGLVQINSLVLTQARKYVGG